MKDITLRLGDLSQHTEAIMCSCGVVIQPATLDGVYWRKINSGVVVVVGGHWHSPANVSIDYRCRCIIDPRWIG